MKIKRIKLTNFRQFYGKNNIIEFSTDDEKNVTLIHAENGVGKTTLLNSILWCLYDKFTADFEHPKNIVNIEALAQGVNLCEVEVEFIHEDKIYSANRKYDEKANESLLSLFAVDKDSYQPIRSDRQLLNSVIPEDMVEYFLFHGEGISQLQAKQTNFRKAIRDILGFTLANQAIDDLEIIKNKWSTSLSKINSNEKKFNKLNSELNQLQSELKFKKNKRHQILELINELQFKKNELDDKIINCKVSDATLLKRNISESEISIKNRFSDLKVNESRRQKLINNYGWKIFGAELSVKSLDFIDTNTLSGKIPAPYDKTLVDDITSSGTCICGRCVTVGTAEYETITNLLEGANTSELKNNLIKARSFAQTIGSEAKMFVDDYNEVSVCLNKLRQEIADLEVKLNSLNIQFDSIDDIEIKKLRSEERNVSSMINNSELSSNSLLREINTYTTKIQVLEKEIEKHTPQDAASFKIQQSLIYVDKIIEILKSKLVYTESNSKLVIAQYVNDILNTFSRKDFSVKVGDNFNFEMVREDGGVVAKSKGEKLLLNLAFVSALIKLAAQRSKAQGKFLQPGTVAPFIIDAPFGELDETYRKATASFLPKNSEQLVLLLSSSHWRGTVGDTIESKVGKEYVLLSHKKSVRGNKPLDEIDIRGVKINQSYYSSDFDGTSIYEVK